MEAQDDLEARVRQRTREFLRAARLADLGVLASGIAHEVNTPLASIVSCAEGLRRRLRNGDLPPELMSEYVETIAEEALRARDITTRMLALVRQEPGAISRVSLDAVVGPALAALRHSTERRGIDLVRAPVDSDAYLEVNTGELVQVLVNLLSNAVDASSPGGRVTLAAAVRGGELVVDVTDEGTGIPDENLDRIFEPFFTTKSPGNGTGLGLALVAAMVGSRGGTVSVTSEDGRGSTFRVTLPARWSPDAA